MTKKSNIKVKITPPEMQDGGKVRLGEGNITPEPFIKTTPPEMQDGGKVRLGEGNITPEPFIR